MPQTSPQPTMPERMPLPPKEMMEGKQRPRPKAESEELLEDKFTSLDYLSDYGFERIPGTAFAFRKNLGFGFDRNGMLLDVMGKSSKLQRPKGVYEVGKPLEVKDGTLSEKGFYKVGASNDKTYYAQGTERKIVVEMNDENKISSLMWASEIAGSFKPFSRPGTKVAISETQTKNGHEETAISISNDLLNAQCKLIQEEDFRVFMVEDIQFIQPITEKLVEKNLSGGNRRSDNREGHMHIGTTNDTERLLQVKEINGKSVEQLEATMRPDVSSASGFLGSNDHLPEVLARDNETVRSYGLTHQDIAKKLEILCDVAFVSNDDDKPVSIEFSGQNLLVSKRKFMGYQESPFDKDRAFADIVVKNSKTKESFRFSMLLIGMIGKYGFYEGNVPYRLDPDQIAKVLGIKKVETKA